MPYGRVPQGHPVIVDYFYHEEIRGSENTGARYFLMILTHIVITMGIIMTATVAMTIVLSITARVIEVRQI